MLRRALLLALLAAALAAAPAQAAGTIARDGTTLRISDTAAIWISIAQTGNQIAITLFSGTELQPQPGSNCSLSGTLITCTGAGALRLVAVVTADARDEVDVTALGPDLDWEAGGGADRLIARGAAGRMVMRGGAGDDFFEGGGAPTPSAAARAATGSSSRRAATTSPAARASTCSPRPTSAS